MMLYHTQTFIHFSVLLSMFIMCNIFETSVDTVNLQPKECKQTTVNMLSHYVKLVSGVS